MKIVVWNSQGAKWDRAATYARFSQMPDEDLLLLLVEGGLLINGVLITSSIPAWCGCRAGCGERPDPIILVLPLYTGNEYELQFEYLLKDGEEFLVLLPVVILSICYNACLIRPAQL